MAMATATADSKNLQLLGDSMRRNLCMRCEKVVAWGIQQLNFLANFHK